MGADRDGSMLMDRTRRKKEEKRSESSAKAASSSEPFLSSIHELDWAAYSIRVDSLCSSR